MRCTPNPCVRSDRGVGPGNSALPMVTASAAKSRPSAVKACGDCWPVIETPLMPKRGRFSSSTTSAATDVRPRNRWPSSSAQSLRRASKTCFSKSSNESGVCQRGIAKRRRNSDDWLRQAGPTFDASLAMEFLGFEGPEIKEGLASHLEKRPPIFPKQSPF